MKKIITILFLSVSFFGFSQKVKLKKGEVLVDKVLWSKYKEFNTFDYSIYNLKGDEIIYLKYVKQGPNNMVFSREGEPNYYEISFLGLNKKIEIRNFAEEILSIIYDSKAVNEDGTFNQEKVDRIIEKFGTPFSDKSKKAINNPNTIIINNNQQPQRSGININLGR